MKKVLIFTFVINCFAVFSGYFKVSDIIQMDMYETESIFPVLHSELNPKAAEKINTYLHYAELIKVFGKEDDNIFSNVFPTEEGFWGQTGFSYTIYRNDDLYFSIGISYDNTGAYTEYYTDYFTFVSKTGEHITLNDFFAETPLETIGEIINGRCADKISNFIQTIDPNQEDASEQIEMYEECLNNRSEDSYIYPGNFRMEEDGMVFIIERCSNHMMAALDELWVFEEEMTYDVLANFYSQNPLDAHLEGNWPKNAAVTLNDKILNGTINKSYPITARLQLDVSQGEVGGVYWYDKNKLEIRLSGTISEDGTYEITEYNNEEEITGFFYGKVENGVFSGNWENKDHSKSMPFILTVD